jgi:hypothetical protein
MEDTETMTKRLVTAFSTLIIFLATLSHGITAEKSLRATLEETWSKYLEAGKSGEELEFQKTMSSFRYGTMKNNIAGAKRSLTPDVIRSIAEDGPDISKAEFVTMMEKGPTAGLLYVKDSEEKDASGKPRVTFIFIKFVKEESGWKVDAGMSIGSPKFQDDGKKMEFDPGDLPPTYEIDGQVQKTPEPEKAPDFAALLDVFSYGYKTEVTVNGVKQGEPVESSSSGLLKGGLRKGKNSIVITVTQTDKDAKFTPTTTIRRILENQKTEEVFKFEPKDNIEGKHTLVLSIDS